MPELDMQARKKSDVPSILRFVRADDGQQAVTLKERASCLVGEKVRAAAHVVMHEALRTLLLPKVLYGIGPKDVTHKTRSRGLAKAVKLRDEYVRVRHLSAVTVGTTYAPNVIQSIKLGRQPAMNTEKLLVHDGSEGERAERVHAGLVQALRIFTLTCM